LGARSNAYPSWCVCACFAMVYIPMVEELVLAYTIFQPSEILRTELRKDPHAHRVPRSLWLQVSVMFVCPLFQPRIECTNRSSNATGCLAQSLLHTQDLAAARRRTASTSGPREKDQRLGGGIDGFSFLLFLSFSLFSHFWRIVGRFRVKCS